MTAIRYLSLGVLAGFLCIGCGKGNSDNAAVPPESFKPTRRAGISEPAASKTAGTLVDARANFHTQLIKMDGDHSAPPKPPAGVFDLVKYDAPLGKLSAYVSPDPKNGQKNPAIIWITGGDCNGIDDGCWTEGPPANDQSASAFRKTGTIMMFPSLRGGNDNPGQKEGFLGEVDDILAAADYLGKLDYVDPQRIYLGGHSTGGTMVLVTSEISKRFRAVFSFGPADNVQGYPREFIPFALNSQEIEVRSPIKWLTCIDSPVFVFEGTSQGNLAALNNMAKAPHSDKVHFFPIPGGNHFSVLTPATKLIAEKVKNDTGPTCNISFTTDELKGLFQRKVDPKRPNNNPPKKPRSNR